MTIAAVGFDLDDTLYDRNLIYTKVFETMEKEVVATGLSFTTFNLIFQKYSESEYKLYMQGKKSKDDYVVERVILAYKESGFLITPEEGQYFNHLYQEYQLEIRLRPGAIETIKLLTANGIQTFILTNGSEEGQRKKIQILKMTKLIDDSKIFISGQLNLSKPNKAIFDYISANLAIPPQQILYIGDNLENDIQGALAAKWQALWLNQYGNIDGSADFPTSSSFEEIKNYLTKNI